MSEAITFEIGMDCRDLEVAAKFWMAALGYVPGVADIERYKDAAAIYYSLIDPSGERSKIILQRVPEEKVVKNRLHLDLDVADIESEAARLIELGAHRTDQEPFHEAGAVWIRMSDPEGNEFCLVQK